MLVMDEGGMVVSSDLRDFPFRDIQTSPGYVSLGLVSTMWCPISDLDYETIVDFGK